MSRNSERRWIRMSPTTAVVAALCGAVLAATASVAHAEVTVIRAGQIFVGNGEVIERGMVILRDGRIVAVGVDLPLPDGSTVVDARDGVVTPGLIDANAFLEPANLLAASRDASPGAANGEAHSLSFAAGDDAIDGADRGATLGHATGRRGRFLAQLIMHQHTEEECSVCDMFAVADSCAFAAAHDDLEDDVNCPVCGYPGTMFEHLSAASGVRPGLVLSESSSEIVPHTHLIDSLNLRSPDLERLVRGGVTTVFAAPDTTSVIGPQGAILRTAGRVRDRVIEPSAAVTASISTDPFRGAVRNSPPRLGNVTFNSRRPNTRMGLTWVFRKAFHDARSAAEGRPIGGADTPSAEAIPVLQRILDGDLSLRIHARQQNDIEAAIRLANEFDLSFTLVEATEAYKTINAIRNAGVPVIFGPIWIDPSGPRARMADSRDSRLSTIVSLIDAGVTTALSAQDLREEEGLARQLMFAVRAGLDPAAALAAATSTPAKLLGLDDRLGTIEVGKDAELVVWNAPPHESGSHPLLVLIGGEVVHRH